MRIIKFRAWDKISRKFVDDFIIDRLGNEYQTNKCEFWGDDREIVLMQYTGLKDKNGKEIYEGDIVRFQGQSNRGNWADFEHKCSIEWNAEWASFIAITLNKEEAFNMYSCDYFSLEEIEIIGNIYENPEIL